MVKPFSMHGNLGAGSSGSGISGSGPGGPGGNLHRSSVGSRSSVGPRSSLTGAICGHLLAPAVRYPS